MQQPRRRSWALSHSVATWSPPTCPSRASARCVPPTSPSPSARLRHQAAGVASWWRGGPEISVRVYPAMVRNSHPPRHGGTARSTRSSSRASTAASSCSTGAGRAAGHRQRRARRRHRRGAAISLGFRRPGAVSRLPVKFRPTDELRSAYYLSIDVADRPGVLAAVAAVFGDHQVSIRSMEQTGLGDEARLIFLTHVARRGRRDRVHRRLRRLPVVDEVGGVLRIVDGDDDPGGMGLTWAHAGAGLIEEYRRYLR